MHRKNPMKNRYLWLAFDSQYTFFTSKTTRTHTQTETDRDKDTEKQTRTCSDFGPIINLICKEHKTTILCICACVWVCRRWSPAAYNNNFSQIKTDECIHQISYWAHEFSIYLFLNRFELDCTKTSFFNSTRCCDNKCDDTWHHSTAFFNKWTYRLRSLAASDMHIKWTVIN